MEESDYKEMLGIDVFSSTITVKPAKKKKVKEIKNKVIEKVNKEEKIKEEPILDVIEKKAQENSEQVKNESSSVVKVVSKKKSKINIVGLELVIIGLLVGVILLSTAFLPKSGIATFFGQVFSVERKDEDLRTYSDFDMELPYNIDQIKLENGIITISPSLSVYPLINGEVSEVFHTDDGFTVTVLYNDIFKGAFSGLKHCYFNSGDKVYKTLPIGYSSSLTTLCFLDKDNSLISDYSIDNAVFSWL